MATDDEDRLKELLGEAYDEQLFSPNPDNPFWQVSLSNAKPLTRADFDTAVDLIYRDHGVYGRHSTECIYMTHDDAPTDWLCAPDCIFEVKRRRSLRSQEAEPTDPSEDHSWTDEEE